MKVSKSVVTLLYLVVMVGLIVGVDVRFLQGRLWVRLIVNILIVVVFLTVYMVFLRDR
ncbi:MAG TPA: hypothetical protein PLS63_11880 [Microthrixaceae bacterium]|nr:hypothetical protein [Microthrixaceae bacterium]